MQEKYQKIFCTELRKSISELEQALEAQEWEDCFHIAHKQKGSAAMMGCRKLSNFFAELEIIFQKKEYLKQPQKKRQEIEEKLDLIAAKAHDFRELKQLDEAFAFTEFTI